MGDTNRGKETVIEESEIIEDGDSVEVIRHVGNLLNDEDSPTESELGISLNTGTETETSAMMPMLERGNRSLISNVWAPSDPLSY
jgi:hypothetical protein